MKLYYHLLARLTTTPEQRDKLAARRYGPYLNTVERIDRFERSLSPLEKAMLALWEHENPLPSIGRDWKRHPLHREGKD